MKIFYNKTIISILLKYILIISSCCIKMEFNKQDVCKIIKCYSGIINHLTLFYIYFNININFQFFCIPFDKQSNGDSSTSNIARASAICKRVAQSDHVSIEISQARDESLTLLVVGRPDDVAHARKSLVQRLQTQVTHTVCVPKDIHKYILGAKGARLSQLELKTSTRIQLPHRNEENAEDIIITGSEEGVRVAKDEIELIRDQQVFIIILYN